MRVALLQLFLIVLVLSLALHTAQPALSQTELQATYTPVAYLPFVGRGGDAVVSAPSNFEQRVVELTNVVRVEGGCPPLQLSAALTVAARAHSNDMAARSFFDHIGSDGSTSMQRIARAGYQAQLSAENIAAGFATPDSVVNAWSTSPGHRQNILNCALVEIGVGYIFDATSDHSHYWTQDFGRP